MSKDFYSLTFRKLLLLSPFSFDKQKQKWLGSEVNRAPTKCLLLFLPFIFFRDSQLLEMRHFKQSSTSYLDKIWIITTPVCAHFFLLFSKDGHNQAWQTTDFYQSAFNTFWTSETKGMRKVKCKEETQTSISHDSRSTTSPGSLSKFSSTKWGNEDLLHTSHLSLRII